MDWCLKHKRKYSSCPCVPQNRQNYTNMLSAADDISPDILVRHMLAEYLGNKRLSTDQVIAVSQALATLDLSDAIIDIHH